MAYTAKTWVNNSAPSVCAANLNDLETGVADAHTTADRAVAKGVLQAKGDLIAALSASSPTRVVVGADNTVLVADAAQTHGLKWVQIGNAQVLAAAAIAYSKLNLAGSIVNADVAAGAAIAKSKLAALAISDSDVVAGAAIAYSKLALAGSIVDADIASSASISAPKIAGFPADSAKFLRGDATWAAPSSGQATGSFSAYRGTAQSISTAWIKAQMNTEEWDISGWYDHVTDYRYTPLTAGYYRFTAVANWGSSLAANSMLGLNIYKNGASGKVVAQHLISASDNIYTITGSGVFYANGTTDYFEMWVYQNGLNPANLSAGAANSYFQGELIGTA